MSLGGMCDLHCHYLPAVDDGTRDAAQGVALCQGLFRLGFETVVATPHIRTGMFDNEKPGLQAAFEAFWEANGGAPDLPTTALAAEHFCDDVFFELLARDAALPYPGGHAALVEFPPERIPLGIEARFFRMQVRGLRPVLAHPERYAPTFKGPEPIEALVERGALALLDVMALCGKYGRRPQRAAETLLERGVYFAACSDTHRPDDLTVLARGLERLVELVGQAGAAQLLCEHPRQILSGTVED